MHDCRVLIKNVIRCGSEQMLCKCYFEPVVPLNFPFNMSSFLVLFFMFIPNYHLNIRLLVVFGSARRTFLQHYHQD